MEIFKIIDARFLALLFSPILLSLVVTVLSFVSPGAEGKIRTLTIVTLLIQIVFAAVLAFLVTVNWGFADEASRGRALPPEEFRILSLNTIAAVIALLVPIACAVVVIFNFVPVRTFWTLPWVSLFFACVATVTYMGGIGNIQELIASAKRTEAESKEYRDATRKAETEKKEKLRAAYAAGDLSIVCELCANDPDATLAQFQQCKTRLETLTPAMARWNEFKNFRESESSFNGWRPEQLGHAKGSGGFYEKSRIPESEQIWFIKAYVEAWFGLDDATFVNEAANVRMAIQGLNFAAFTPAAQESFKTTSFDAVVDRLKKLKATQSDSFTQSQIDLAVSYFSHQPDS